MNVSIRTTKHFACNLHIMFLSIDKSIPIRHVYMTLPDRFHVLCTLSSEYFSTFPHGTCLLLVFRIYLALDGAYHPLCAAFPNNTTPNNTHMSIPNKLRDYNPLWFYNQVKFICLKQTHVCCIRHSSIMSP